VALPLPLSIWFKPKRYIYALLSLLAESVIVYWVLQVWWFHDFPDAPALFCLVLALVYSVSTLLSLHQWIELSEEGMTVRSPFRSKTIRWQAARLFAIDVLAKGSQPAERYELSSETTILRWPRKLKPSRLTRLSWPFPEYAWQMKALLSLIAGRTDLYLYDLPTRCATRLLKSLPLP